MNVELYNLLSLIVTIIGFSITLTGIVFIYKQLVSANKDRETDLLVRLYSISTQEPLSSDFDLIWDMDPDDYKKHEETCLRTTLFFEMIGSITNQNYADTLLVEEYFGSLITGSYQHLSIYIENQRTKRYNEKFASNFERLSNTMGWSKRISKAPENH